MRKLLIALVAAGTLATPVATSHTAQAVSGCSLRLSSGRYFSAVCYGSGGFRTRALCHNADHVPTVYVWGRYAIAPGVSYGYCPFGQHPGKVAVY